jgi:phosphate transport system substrate-binding protein
MENQMLYKRFILYFSIIIVSALMGCGKGKTPVTLAGSTAFQPFAEKLAQQYMMKNNNVNITVQGGGSAVGIQSALSGAAEIGMADLVVLPPEAKNLIATVVAKDGIALVVNPKNTVTNLTTDQVRDIFNGKITNWKEVGGSDNAITVVSREAGSGTRSSFEMIIQNVNLMKKAVIQNSNGTVRETVANDGNSIGYVSHGLINEKIKPLKIDNVECTTDLIIAGIYKLVRPIYLLTREVPTGESKKFIDYILSSEGQNTLKADGLIPAK